MVWSAGLPTQNKDNKKQSMNYINKLYGTYRFSIRLTSFAAGAEIKLEPLFLIDQLFWSPKTTIYNFHSQLALLNRIQIDFISLMPSTHYRRNGIAAMLLLLLTADVVNCCCFKSVFVD